MTQGWEAGRKEKILDVKQKALTAEEKKEEALAPRVWVLVARNGVGDGIGSQSVSSSPD